MSFMATTAFAEGVGQIGDAPNPKKAKCAAMKGKAAPKAAIPAAKKDEKKEEGGAAVATDGAKK